MKKKPTVIQFGDGLVAIGVHEVESGVALRLSKLEKPMPIGANSSDEPSRLAVELRFPTAMSAYQIESAIRIMRRRLEERGK
jgi:hypothetical protein